MKFKILLFLIFLSVKLFASNHDTIYISYACNEQSLIKAAKVIAEKGNFEILINPDWDYNYNVSSTFDSVLIEQAFNKLFSSTPYGTVFLEPNLVYIIKKEGFIFQLPDFNNSNNDQQIITEKAVVEIKQKYLKGRTKVGLDTIKIGNQRSFYQQKQVMVEGNLFAEESGEPLIGATIYIKDLSKGAATDEFGYFSMKLPPNDYMAEFRCLGRQTTTKILKVNSTGSFSIKIPKQVNSLTEITVSGDVTKGLRGEKIGLERISSKKMKELPSLMGEKDVIKVSQLLPGVTSINEGSSGVNVRGGNADQNLFLINGIPLYNTSHVYGFFSSINQYIIDDFSLYKGHMPIEFSGKLSSVFDIGTRNGNKKSFFAQGGISPISAGFSAEGPLVKEKGSFVVSGRGSYSDWIVKRVKNNDVRNSNIDFYDFSASANWNFNSKTKVKAFVYYSNDKLNVNNLNRYDYSNLGASIIFNKRFNSVLKAQITAYSSLYKASNAINSVEALAYKHGFEIFQNEINGKLSWKVADFMDLTIGGMAKNYDFDRGIVEPFGEKSKIVPEGFGTDKAFENAVFSEFTFEPAHRIKISAGFRYNFFVNTGPGEVLNYEPNQERVPQNVLDTTFYGNNHKIATYKLPEVRVGVNYKLTDFTKVKLSYRQTQQSLFLLSNNYSISPVDQWKMADNHIEPATADQFSLGVYKDEPSIYSTFSIEAYYRKSNNILEFKDGANFTENKYVEMETLQGEQEAYGVEFLLSKDKGQFFGWLSYTYSRSFNTVSDKNGWGEINYGETYPSNFDVPHAVNFIGNYRINKRLLLSTIINYSTGRPITLPQAVFYIDNNQYIDYSKRNQYRLPHYFRMDFSLSVEGNLKREKKVHSTWMLNVYNVTGRQNPFSIYFLSEEGGFKGYQYSVIGVPVFTVSWNFKFGNYESN